MPPLRKVSAPLSDPAGVPVLFGADPLELFEPPIEKVLPPDSAATTLEEPPPDEEPPPLVEPELPPAPVVEPVAPPAPPAVEPRALQVWRVSDKKNKKRNKKGRVIFNFIVLGSAVKENKGRVEQPKTSMTSRMLPRGCQDRN